MESRAVVEADLLRQLGEADPAVLGNLVQNRKGAIDRLDAASFASSLRLNLFGSSNRSDMAHMLLLSKARFFSEEYGPCHGLGVIGFASHHGYRSTWEPAYPIIFSRQQTLIT
jgi:hypothetical protein